MANNKRQNILIVLLLLSIGIYVIQKEYSFVDTPQFEQVAVQDFSNELVLDSVEAGQYFSKLFVSYQYNGEFGRHVSVLIRPKIDDPSKIVMSDKVNTARGLKIGKHKDVFQVQRPCRTSDRCTASEVELKIIKSKDYYDYRKLGKEIDDIPFLFQKSFSKKLEWIVRNPTTAEKKKHENLDLAIWFLDNGTRSNLKSAKNILDKIFIETPDNVQAHIELARYHMKSSWTELGLKRAEEALNNAYGIDKDNANVFVLRGYVYTHQSKYSLAEKDFVRASELKTDNLWLYANWGEMFQMKEDDSKALEYYKLAIEPIRKNYKSDNRAKLAAFTRTQGILVSQKKFKEVDKLLEEKVKQFSGEPCYLAEWAEFKLGESGNFSEALRLARKAISSDCNRDNYAKQVYADALITDWFIKSTESENGDSSLVSGVAIDPNWPRRIYRFASKERLNPILMKLLRTKVEIDELDTRSYTALAYAVTVNDSRSVRKLIKLGANPNKQIEGGYSVFFLSLITSNEETIKAFLDSGVKLDRNFKNGITVEQLLQQRGMDILGSNENI